MKNKAFLLLIALGIFASLPLQAFAATNYPFTYDFTNLLYVQSFNMNYTNNDTITLNLTSQAPDDPNNKTGQFTVYLDQCTKNSLGICSWSEVRFGTANYNGTAEFLWYSMPDGIYRFRFVSNGERVTGYGYYSYSSSN